MGGNNSTEKSKFQIESQIKNVEIKNTPYEEIRNVLMSNNSLSIKINSIIFQYQNPNEKEFKKLEINKMSDDLKNILIFISTLNNNHLLKLLKHSIKTNVEATKSFNLYINTEPYIGNFKEYLQNSGKNKFEIKEIKNIFIQINDVLIDFYLNNKINKIKISKKNILYSKINNEFKFYYFPMKYDSIQNNNYEYINILKLCLLLYNLFKGKNFKSKNKNKNEDITEKIKNIKNDISEQLEKENSENKKLILDLIKNCFEEMYINKKLNFIKYFTHTFFNHIYIGKIENIIENKENEEKVEYLFINVINIPKIFFKKLKLKCYKDEDKFYHNLNDFVKDFENREKEKENQLIIFRIINYQKDQKDIKTILSNINSNRIDNPDLDMPFIIFYMEENKDIKEEIIKMIKENELNRIDKRFIFYIKWSDDLNNIEKIIYRAYSYYNELGDIFNLNNIQIDLREKKYDFYLNIICISRSQQGKSTFINKYINSFRENNIEEVRAREGGSERACSTKVSEYYINELPIKLIDIIGFDGKEDTQKQLDYIINSMSIVMLRNEIHLILYFIKYESDNLFFENEVKIFETLKLNVIKPKILFIRTKTRFNANIYEKNANGEIILNIDKLAPRQKENLKNKIINLNTNFKKIREDKEGIWDKIIKFIFSQNNEEDEINEKYFNYENVIFVNFKVIEDDNDEKNDIQPFGMDYLKQAIIKTFKKILTEEEKRLENWEKIKYDFVNNKNADMLEIIKKVNYYNISTRSLSQQSNNIIRELINEKLNTRLKLDIKKVPPKIFIFSCDKCKKMHILIACILYGMNKSENNELEVQINETLFPIILEEFISYKIKCISSIEYYFKTKTDNECITNQIKEINNNNINKKQDNNKNIDNDSNISYNIDNNRYDNLSTEISFNKEINIDNIVYNTKGIINSLNECYIISSLQCLIHCKIFIENLFKEKDKIFKDGITNEFINICEIQSNNIYNLDSLDKFKQLLKEKKYQKKEQEDSMEFCRSLLGQISDELNIAKKYKPKLEYESLDFENMPLLESYRKFKDNIYQRENSIVTNIFNVNIINKCICKLCNHESTSYQAELGLILTLKIENNQTIELQNIIKQNFEDETVDKKCENCKKGKKAKKSKGICKLPEILILSIQEKIEDTYPIKINKELNLKKYVNNELITNNNTIYELISIINHQGAYDKGHYFSYINIKNEWYYFSDDIVEKMDSFDYTNNNVYILYYQLKK